MAALRQIVAAAFLAVYLLLAASTLLPAQALGQATAHMSAAFTPERLGAPTTVSFAFHLTDSESLPSPLTSIELGYPRNLGLATSDLGVSPCDPAALESLGASACPPNSHMGYGSALVGIAFGPDLVTEHTTLTLLAGPSPDGYLHVLVYASGIEPIQAALVITAVLLPGHLHITVPPIPSLPEAPYVSLLEMHITLGGHLTYYEERSGTLVPYHPTGVGLPSTCPHGGFRFAANFAFINGEHAGSNTAVACPRPRSPSRRS